MANKTIKYLMRNNADFSLKSLKKQVSYSRFVYSVLVRYNSHWSKSEDGENPVSKEARGASSQPSRPTWDKQTDSSSRVSKYSSDEDDASASRWKLELAWLTKALEPAFQLFRRALPTGNANGNRPPPSSKSVAEIVASIQRSKLGIQDWSLGDLTLGLYLIYLQQASANPLEDVKGLEISSDTVVLELMYHVELAKGAYRDSTAALARNCMLRESNIVKFVRNSSVLRPGYYIGVDTRNKLVILGIRGTHTVYDIITDIVSSSHEEVTFEGYSSHFGTAEAARWFLHHEMGTIRKYLDKHEGFRLRLVGHSLGGATASLLAMMLRKKTYKELGFSPDIVSAVGIGTPPCVSRELAERCSDYVTTLVMQDDIVPRLSVASLMRLRNEILQTDWASVLEKEDWKGVVDLVTNAKQVVSSVQDVARKLADYTKFGSQAKFSEIPGRKDSLVLPRNPPTDKQAKEDSLPVKEERPTCTIPELFIPGTVYYLKRNEYKPSSGSGRGIDFFTLLKRHPGEHFQRIILSSNVISDHKCDSHLYALRDVLKGIPASHN